MKRKFYDTLMQWKTKHITTPLMVVGARQTGKTYIIDEFCKKEFDDYIYINLIESPNIVDIFEEKTPFAKKIQKLELEIQRKINPDKTIIFIDEIQESETAITSLKFFCDSKIPYKVICAGSLLGVKLNRFHSSFPVGKVRIEMMLPMDFEEFLLALGKDMWLDEIKRCFKNIEPTSIHEQLLELYRLYLCVGGMPQAVKDFVNKNGDILLWDKDILKNILVSYLADMSKYTLNNNEKVKIEKIYKVVPGILARETNQKFKYAYIEKGAKKQTFESAIDWLTSSNMIYKCNLVNNIQMPLKAYSQENIFKLYLNDVAFLTMSLGLNYSDIILNKPFMYKGVIAENYVAQTFMTKGIGLYYWRSKNDAGIDFVIDTQDGIIPVEVKASDNTKSQSLDIYVQKYHPKFSIRLSSKNFGYSNGIKSIPLYAAFCIDAKKDAII